MIGKKLDHQTRNNYEMSHVIVIYCGFQEIFEKEVQRRNIFLFEKLKLLTLQNKC